MPRGDNPNSRANLAKGTPFNAETARKAKEKSDATKKYKAEFRTAGKSMLTDEDMEQMWKAMIARAKNGNISAFKMLFDVMGEAARDNIDHNAEVRLAYIVPQDEPEQPPAVIEDEPDE